MIRRRTLGLAAGAALLLNLVGCAAPPRVKTHTALPGVEVLPAALTMPGLDRQRQLRIYLPPGYAQSSERYRVLYMHDAQNLFDDFTSFVGEWGVDETLDELARSHGLKLIVVGIDNGGDKRMTELNPWDHPKFGKGEGAAYTRFIVEVVKPHIDSQYRTRPEREHTAMMGSSMGGLISHYAIQQYPQVFSKAGIFSPSYWAAPAMRDAAVRPLPIDTRLYLYMGGREGGEMNADVRKVVAALSGQALPAEQIRLSTQAAAEHNEAAWRAEFKPALLWLFQPGAN